MTYPIIHRTRYKGLHEIHVAKDGKLTCIFSSPISGLYGYNFGVDAQNKPRVTLEKIDFWLQGQAAIQHIMPELSAEEREMFISGFSPSEQSSIFGESDDE